MAEFDYKLLLLFSVLLGYGIFEVEASHRIYEKFQTHPPPPNNTYQPYRTGYHFQPLANWMNDPNGPMIYKGIYHLFYQWNPRGSVWGNIVWAHSTSRDLINWNAHPPAIFPSQRSDFNGCWSGSATILPREKPVMLYTGIAPGQVQVQNVAYPSNLSDPYLTVWTKAKNNPIMAPDKENNINSSSFRDPTTAWFGPDQMWRVAVGSKHNDKGMAILYKSKDFVEWTMAKRPLHSARHTGMWECVDFYPVSTNLNNGLDTSSLGENIKHVVKVSLDDTKHDYYTIGSYDPWTDKYTRDKGLKDSDAGLRYDYGKYYASKTFFDSAKNRRILWGWVNESSSVTDDVNKGWSGVQAIPRTVLLDKSGKQLVVWPVVELEQLRENQVNIPSEVLEAGTVLKVDGITAAQADVEISFDVTDLSKAEVLDPSWTNAQWLCNTKNASVRGGLGPFGLRVLASVDSQEYTSVFFRVLRHEDSNEPVVLMCSDQSSSSLNNNNDKTTYGAFLNVDPTKEKLSLRTLIDHSIVESFGGGGKSCIVARVYPTLAVDDKASLFAFNNATEGVKMESLNAWSMKKAQIS